jgi:hypothetical protein
MKIKAKAVFHRKILTAVAIIMNNHNHLYKLILWIMICIDHHKIISNLIIINQQNLRIDFQKHENLDLLFLYKRLDST